ncbi:response regulator [Oceanospirillum sanctuarii]|uniref:response regulator n=1 Tax=Oceanospirillum sanctuarii TaxID=1434821 RepID=UPI001594DB4A|nr:response regulator [Oceanospirillum sanctuarii]
MPETDQPLRISLKKWIYKAYVRSNMVQLIFVNAAFLILLLGTFFLLGLNQQNTARKEYEQQLIGALQSKTDWVNARLSSVQSQLQVLQRQTERTLTSDQPGDWTTPLDYTEGNVLMKPQDDGGVAVYYSTQSRDLSSREEKARKLLPLSYLFADLQQANQLVKQVYLNTPDNLNLLYPYQDVHAQFAPDLDLTTFSFYYLADKTHNPQRQPVWTDAYLDPAGLGWIISHIAPVYDGDSLEAVVGLDLTVETLISNLFSLPQPWSGYAVLVGKDGNILALPPEGEEDFGLKELTDGQYSFRHVTTNEFKPELFNLYKRPEMSDLSRLVAHQQAGLAQIELNRPSVVAWNTVPLTGWKLLAVTPQEELYAQAEGFAGYLKDIGLLVLLLILILFALHLGIHKSRSRKLYQQMQGPLEYFDGVARAALEGKAMPQKTLSSPVTEIQNIADLLRRFAQENDTLKQQLDQYQASCHKQNDHFRSLLNSIPMPVFDTDSEYRLQGCNRAFEQFFGKSEAELKGHLLTEFIPVTPPDDGSYSKELVLTSASKESHPVSVVLSRATDNSRSESSRGELSRIEGGRIDSSRREYGRGRPMVGLLMDLSDQYQARDQMKFDRDRALEASKLQTEYLQAMRRELEGPLLNLVSLTEQLREQPDQRERLSLLLKEKVDALMYLTRDNWVTENPDAPPTPKPKGEQKQSHVLVVDDGPVNTMLAKSALQKVGYEVDVVNSGQEALELMTEKTYQVVLMDIFMPEMDGIETTIRWREREKAMQLSPAAIIAVTANVLESERQRFFDAGMNEYLAKPYHPSELRSRVDHWRQQYEEGQVPA